MFLLLLRPSKVFIFFHSAQGSEWCLGGNRSPQRQRVCPSSPLYLCCSLGRCPSVFANLSAHCPQRRQLRVRKETVHDSPPHPVYHYMYRTVSFNSRPQPYKHRHETGFSRNYGTGSLYSPKVCSRLTGLERVRVCDPWLLRPPGGETCSAVPPPRNGGVGGGSAA
jgi:hypothetical protein